MRTSEPGTSAKALPRRVLPERGFTLLEILVVVAIIGIFVGITVLSTDLVSFERRLEQEARRLGTLIDFATEEALLQTQDLGLLVAEDGYRFYLYDYDRELWRPFGDQPFGLRELEDDVRLSLRVEDREVVLESSTEAFFSDVPEELTERERSELPEPQIAVLASGEITPFELGFLRESDPLSPGVRLDVAFDGSSEVVRGAP